MQYLSEIAVNDSDKGHSIYSTALLVLIYTLPVLTVLGGGVATGISGIVLILILLMSQEKQFYLVLPIAVVFYSQLVAPAGLVVFRIYTLLYLLNVFVHKGKILKASHMGILLIISVYALFVLSSVDIRLSIMMIFDVIFLLVYASNNFEEAKNLRWFIRAFTAAIILAGIYGILNSTNNVSTYVQVNGAWQNVFRVVGTFEDPNYFGLFINIGIFGTLILEDFKMPKLKMAVLIFLYYLLISSLSMTGILCNIVGLLGYFIFIQKMNIKYILWMIAAIVFLVAVSNSSLINYIPILSNFVARFTSLQSFELGSDIGQITSDRSNIWNAHWDFFKEQSLLRMFIGGNRIVPISIDWLNFHGLSHQEYIDQLLNIGIVGFVFFSLYFISTIKYHLSRYTETKNKEFLAIIFIKYIWFFYGFSLTLFLDNRFMLFFIM